MGVEQRHVRFYMGFGTGPPEVQLSLQLRV